MARHKQGKVVSMQKIREAVRLSLACGISTPDIAASCSLSEPTVRKYVGLAAKSGLSAEELIAVDDETLRQALGIQPPRTIRGNRAMPDWAAIREELAGKSVTMQLLWQEYIAINPQGYRYSQFCELFRCWQKKVDVCLRQTHPAGKKMFVDYAGETIAVHQSDGSILPAVIFVAVLGASNYTYAEAQESQNLECWISGHVRALSYFGGVPEAIVPDNLKSGVSRACRYEPEINPTYQEMAAHYGCVVIPARVRKPRDKAKVEVGVQIVQRWILAALRKRRFLSLAELNAAIAQLLEQLNQRAFKKLPGCRKSLFQTLEAPALRALPEQAYEFAQWKKARVNIDYHIDLAGHYYSVPYTLAHAEVDVRAGARTLEVFYRHSRVASHLRSNKRGAHTTLSAHMPPAHQRHLEWSPSRLINWAATLGRSTQTLVETILERRHHPEQGYRSCLGIMRLAKQYSGQRLEAACARALLVSGYSYRSVHSILEKGLDRQLLPSPPTAPAITHENVRGSQYFNNAPKIDMPECLSA